jgi:ubiquinone biosynthesis protein
MLSLKPDHMARYAAVVKLLLKYGRGDIVRQAGFDALVEREVRHVEPDSKAGPEVLARDLELLGPTFVKLGQLLSTRADFLPVEYLDALERLQDDVEPLPFCYVQETVERELGVRISKAFSEFDPVPLATGSIGQVHKAALRDGRRVIVKVQRPDLRERVSVDLEALADLAKLVDDHTAVGRRIRFVQMVESLGEVMIGELDYRQEAENAHTLRRNLAGLPLFYVPWMVDDYTTRCVLTQEYVEGTKITHVSPLVLLELDRKEYADQLFRVYLQQVLIDGVFHADPHPGNLLLTNDRRIALMDFGMVSRASPELRSRLVKLLTSMSDGRAEQTVDEAIAIGTPYKRGEFDEEGFRSRVIRFVTENHGKPVARLQAGKLVMEINGAAGETGLELPHAVVMLGKVLMNLDKVVKTLDPEFDPNAALRRHAGEMFQKHSLGLMSLPRLYSALLESAEFAERLPERLNKTADLIAQNKLKITVDAFDEKRLITGMQKIANRITSGLILAAMIIAASLMMHLRTSLTLFGYPAIALVFFCVAAFASFWLLCRMTWYDESDRSSTSTHSRIARH